MDIYFICICTIYYSERFIIQRIFRNKIWRGLPSHVQVSVLLLGYVAYGLGTPKSGYYMQIIDNTASVSKFYIRINICPSHY